jgi:hypothetical protein
MDFGNGVQALVAPILAKKLGCQVVAINGQIDGDFLARGSEPTPENLHDLSFLVKELGPIWVSLMTGMVTEAYFVTMKAWCIGEIEQEHYWSNISFH